MANELILIVDDHASNLKLARDVLRFAGYRTLEAHNAKDGIELARLNLPDLILMDIQLPGMDGIEALGQLRAEPRTAAIRVVAFTAFARTEEQERIMSAGFQGYLTKPVDIRQLREKVRDVCGAPPPE
jgi:CheY-like chemotaxis protein